jgi:diguanylate cyclase (GGDEF)-like protein
MAVEIGERVREAVAALDLGRYRVPGVTVSVGVAVGGRPDRPVDELIADADRALYEAKRKGRDRVVANLGLMASPRSAAELGGGLRPRG